MKITLIWPIVFWTLSLFAQDDVLVPFESTWSYLDDGSNQGTLWRTPIFDDSSWATGQAPLGYGEGNENTVVSFGADPDNKYITTYFRHTFVIDDVSRYKNFLIKLKKDDGALIYVNGGGVMRSNFGAGGYDYRDEAYSVISSEEEDIIWEEIIPTTRFRTGENIIAVEVHQYEPESSDLIFDLELIGFDGEPSLYRSPYLQKSTHEGVTIKWKTDVPTNSKVTYGTSVDDLSSEIFSPDSTINHEVTISGLQYDTRYYYMVGDASVDFAGGSPDFFFTTHPIPGTSKPTRIWVTGDAGTGKDEQRDVRDSYLNFAGITGKSDLWLMMGDNAYEHGREADYHMGLFTVYQSILRNTVSFPTTGNHDLFAEASAHTETGTYYDIFALPKNGECGGIPSGKESYYSVDFGNVHLICLESYDLDRGADAAMATWLKNDLENTDADWLIAYWHFAPYTKVDHDSDDPNDWSGRAIEMRENINPILESHGVDLVLSGHSHGYERSYLINGHYGFSNTLQPDMILDNSSGRMDLSEEYTKPQHLVANQGAVYVVCGNSGKVGSLEDSGPHPVMYETNTDDAGSVVIDIAGDVLEAKFINEQGFIRDYFHIVKPNLTSVEGAQRILTFDLFPNPGHSQVRVAIDADVEWSRCHVEFYTSDGKKVKSIDADALVQGKVAFSSMYPISLQGYIR